MANRFWVGGGASTNWNATSNTNWASTSGGANNATVPGTSDFAIFDANSGSGAAVISAAIAVQGVDCTGFTGTITHNNFTLTINTAAANALKLAAGMTYTPASISSLVTFTNTSGTAVLTSAGKTFAAITVNGVGGTVQQGDDLQVNAVQNAALTITNGVFDGNSHALTACIIASSNSNTRSLLLGSSVTIGGNVATGQTIWNLATATGLTFTKNSANITILSPTSSILQQTFSPGSGGLTYNGITFNATTSGVTTGIPASMTCASLAVGSGNSLEITAGQTLTVTAAFTLAGTSSAPIAITSNNQVSAATISCSSGSCTLNWGILYAITAAGGATFTATNTLAAGGANSGWAITPPADASAGGIVTSLMTDLLSSSDFSTAGSIGALLKSLANLQFTVQSIGRGTVTTGASTTSIPTSAFAPATSASVANQLAGRVVLFDYNTTTVALRGQVATISASSASATPTLTVSTLTATPASGDTFSVI